MIFRETQHKPKFKTIGSNIEPQQVNIYLNSTHLTLNNIFTIVTMWPERQVGAGQDSQPGKCPVALHSKVTISYGLSHFLHLKNVWKFKNIQELKKLKQTKIW